MVQHRLDYAIERVFERRIPKFGVQGREYRLRVSEIPNDLHYALVCDMVHDVIARMLSELLEDEHGVARYPDHHRVRFSLSSPGLDHEIWIPFIPPRELTVDRVMLSVEKVLQSNSDWVFGSSMSAMFVHAPLPHGARGLGAYHASAKTSDFLRRKRSLVRIPVDEYGMCLARALVVGVAYADGHPRYKSLVRARSYLQIRLARALCRKAGVDPSGSCGFREWEAFQRALGSSHSIVVVSRDMFDRIVYYGRPGAPKQVCVYHVEDHYHVVTRLAAFLGCGYICPHCLVKCRSKVGHTCSSTCYYCRGAGECLSGERVYCSSCNIRYPNSQCFDRHIAEGFCERRSRCSGCGKVCVRGRNHKCGWRVCSRCKSFQPVVHECYMQILPRNVDESAPRCYIFYDFESMLVEGGLHKPNLCVVHRVCTLCMDKPMHLDGFSCSCNRERLIFEGQDSLEKFGEYVLNGQRSGAICLAHNSSSYDCQFLLSFVHSRGMMPRLVLQGRKIMCMSVRGVRFVDSMNFFPMGLARLPKAFGLKELRKGYFPHLFNAPSSQGYVGPMPDVCYYGADGMSPERRRDFLEWYESQRGKTFHFREELLSYCVSDVDILQRCCGVFRRLFVEQTGLEPFTKSITIASACNRVYRTNYLRPRELGLIPPEGFFRGRQSAIALCWLEGLCLSDPSLRIAHYGNGGEQRVLGRLVDGVDVRGGVYFFHGCFWHSCRSCYPSRGGLHPVKGVTHRENYDQTSEFVEAVRASGRSVTVMWECEYTSTMTPHDRTRVERWKTYDPLRPRDAFYGGRCNATTLYAKAGPGECIKYVDFTSLYPYVNKYCLYPTHHPVVYTGADIPERVEGLLKCKVMAPDRLYHPVLPYRARGKLLFPLCRTCADTGSSEPCTHRSVEDRALVGTWVTVELEKALSVGYRIVQRYEAWHFPNVSRYDRETKSGGIWSEFISRWVGLKQEASGYPQGVETDAEKRAYVEAYEREEGIRLDPSRIEKNEGLRSLAKLMANSHWGKSAQQSNKVQVSYIHDPGEYVRMMSDSTVTVHDVFHVSDECVALQWSRSSEYDEGLPHTNVVLAAYTTAHARLRLYDILERLGERAMYFDTDSVIYLHLSDGSYNPPLGSYLGDLKDELPDAFVTEYCGLGPKNYALRMEGGDTICRVRGFSLNYKTSRLINFAALSEMVLSGDLGKVIETRDEHAIVRERGSLYTSARVKKYRMVYEKRRVLEDGIHTLPFGWV